VIIGVEYGLLQRQPVLGRIIDPESLRQVRVDVRGNRIIPKRSRLSGNFRNLFFGHSATKEVLPKGCEKLISIDEIIYHLGHLFDLALPVLP
jgi:hypothetical protein